MNLKTYYVYVLTVEPEEDEEDPGWLYITASDTPGGKETIAFHLRTDTTPAIGDIFIVKMTIEKGHFSIKEAE